MLDAIYHTDRLTLSLAHWLTHSLTHRLIHTLTHRLTDSRRLAERLPAGGGKLLGEAACCETRRWLTEGTCELADTKTDTQKKEAPQNKQGKRAQEQQQHQQR